MTGDRLFNKAEQRSMRSFEENRAYIHPQSPIRSYAPTTNASSANIPATSFQPIHRASIRQESPLPRPSTMEKHSEPINSRSEPEYTPEESPSLRPEPVYQPILASPKQNTQVRKL